MYGYGYGKSQSGWESSLFGGFRRVLSDYPFIEFTYKVDINMPKELKNDLGLYLGEKLIKLYLLKMNELNLVSQLKYKEIEKESYFGIKTTKYIQTRLNDVDIFNFVCKSNSEMAPLFNEYKEYIFGTTLDMEIPEDKSGGKGDKEDGEGEEQEGKGDKEDGEGEKQEGKGDKEDGEGEKGEGEKGEDRKGEDAENSENESEGKGNEESKPSAGSDRVDPRQRKNKEGKRLEDYLKNIREKKPYTSIKSMSKFSGKTEFKSFTEDNKRKSITPYKFTPKQRQIGENLVKMLDISFDPKSAEIKNLKLGKLDTSKIAEVPAGNISVYKQSVEEQDTKPFSVCILADMSGSMHQGTRVMSQLNILNGLYLALRQILPDDKLYIYGHSGYDSPVVYTFYSPYDTDYERNIGNYHDVPWYENYDGPVIESIHKSIREKTEDRIIFIVISDGLPCGSGYGGSEDNLELKKIIERARRDQFVTVGIGLEADHVSELYQYSKCIYDLSTISKDVSELINRVVRLEFQ